LPASRLIAARQNRFFERVAPADSGCALSASPLAMAGSGRIPEASRHRERSEAIQKPGRKSGLLRRFLSQ
jgi:hypothetical protein